MPLRVCVVSGYTSENAWTLTADAYVYDWRGTFYRTSRTNKPNGAARTRVSDHPAMFKALQAEARADAEAWIEANHDAA